MIHPVRADTRGRLAAAIDRVLHRRVDLEAEPFRRGERHARSHARQAGLGGFNAAPQLRDPRLGRPHGFDRERFKADRVRGVIAGMKQDQLGGAPV